MFAYSCSSALGGHSVGAYTSWMCAHIQPGIIVDIPWDQTAPHSAFHSAMVREACLRVCALASSTYRVSASPNCMCARVSSAIHWRRALSGSGLVIKMRIASRAFGTERAGDQRSLRISRQISPESDTFAW